MKSSILISSLLISLFALEAQATLPSDMISEQLKPKYATVIHRFYGPWSSLRKRDGDYVDYNDYGARIPDSSLSLTDLTYDGRLVLQENLKEVPEIRGDGLTVLNSDNKRKPIGVADFRTGIRTRRVINEE